MLLPFGWPRSADREHLCSSMRGDAPKFWESEVITHEWTNFGESAIDDVQRATCRKRVLALTFTWEEKMFFVDRLHFTDRVQNRGSIREFPALVFVGESRLQPNVVCASNVREPLERVASLKGGAFGRPSSVTHFRKQHEIARSRCSAVEQSENMCVIPRAIVPTHLRLQCDESGCWNQWGFTPNSNGEGEKKGDRRDLNPRRPGSQPGALPTELRPPMDAQPYPHRCAGSTRRMHSSVLPSKPLIQGTLWHS